MRKWINNPKFVAALVGAALVFFALQYVPPDWRRRWENWVMGEAARLALVEETPPAEAQLPEDRLLAFRPSGLPGEWRTQVATPELARTLFPQVADPEDTRRLVLQQRIPVLPQGLRLDGIYSDGNRRVAMLSGITLGEGEYFQNARVLRIEENGVVFQIGATEKKLELGETVPMLPKPAAATGAGSSPAGPPTTDPTEAALQAEQERLRQLQELGSLPAKLLKGSEQVLPQLLPSPQEKK